MVPLEVPFPPLRLASWAAGAWPMQRPLIATLALQGLPSFLTAGHRWGFLRATLMGFHHIARAHTLDTGLPGRFVQHLREAGVRLHGRIPREDIGAQRR